MGGEQPALPEVAGDWYDGRTFCFKLNRISNTKVYWMRDDGRSGIARVGTLGRGGHRAAGWPAVLPERPKPATLASNKLLPHVEG